MLYKYKDVWLALFSSKLSTIRLHRSPVPRISGAGQELRLSVAGAEALATTRASPGLLSLEGLPGFVLEMQCIFQPKDVPRCLEIHEERLLQSIKRSKCTRVSHVAHQLVRVQDGHPLPLRRNRTTIDHEAPGNFQLPRHSVRRQRYLKGKVQVEL